MNAIERLRAEIESPKFRREDAADWESAADALAAVDALYQAAKELLADGNESHDNPMLYLASSADADALAAAVHQMEQA